jgi:hypothetical protein
MLAIGAGLAIGAVALLLLGLGYAGLAPWSNSLPGYREHAQTGTDPSSFFAARSLGEAAAYPFIDHGSWVLESAVGLALKASLTIPAAGENNSTMGVAVPCTWSGLGGSNLDSITIPPTPAGTPPGSASAWLLEFVQLGGSGNAGIWPGSNSSLVIAVVLDGQAQAYAASGSGCPSSSGQNVTVGDLSSGVIDSTQAAATADAWGGSAFLANYSAASAVYSVTASVSVHYVESVYPPCWGISSNCNGTWANGTPPPPIYVNYTTPSVWEVAYSTDPGLLPGLAANSSSPWTNSSAYFIAGISATNGTVSSIAFYLSPSMEGCWVGCFIGTPVPVPMGGGVGAPELSRQSGGAPLAGPARSP